MAEISIIVPAYNEEDYIVRCIESISCQCFNNIEIIIVDDGSTDSTPRLCDELVLSDTRITVLHTKNNGLSEARNIGTNTATGRYLTYVDSDDYLLPNALQTMYSRAIEQDLDILFCSAYYMKSNGSHYHFEMIPKDREKEIFTGYQFLHDFYQNNNQIVTAWSKLIKVSMIRENRLCFKKGLYHEDVLWMPCLCYGAKRVGYMNNPVYYYFYKPNSITNIQKPEAIRDIIISYHLLEKETLKIPHEYYRNKFLEYFAKDYLYFAGTKKVAFGPYRHLVCKSYLKGKLKKPSHKLRQLIFNVSLPLYAVIQDFFVVITGNKNKYKK